MLILPSNADIPAKALASVGSTCCHINSGITSRQAIRLLSRRHICRNGEISSYSAMFCSTESYSETKYCFAACTSSNKCSAPKQLDNTFLQHPAAALGMQVELFNQIILKSLFWFPSKRSCLINGLASNNNAYDTFRYIRPTYYYIIAVFYRQECHYMQAT